MGGFDFGVIASNLGYGITIAGLLIALLAPVMGQRADRAGQVHYHLLRRQEEHERASEGERR